MQKTFINTHIGISRELFQNRNYDFDNGVRIEEVKPPSLREFLYDLYLVGGRYGWHRRPKYMDYEAIKKRLEDPNSRYFYIYYKEIPVGYVFANKPKSLAFEFFKSSQGKSTIEIENIGLFDGFTGMGIGDTALPKALGMLLADNDYVYLSTRSTNHDRVVPFYEDNGMVVLQRDTMNDDLVPVNDNRLHPCLKVA